MSGEANPPDLFKPLRTADDFEAMEAFFDGLTRSTRGLKYVLDASHPIALSLARMFNMDGDDVVSRGWEQQEHGDECTVRKFLNSIRKARSDGRSHHRSYMQFHRSRLRDHLRAIRRGESRRAEALAHHAKSHPGSAQIELHDSDSGQTGNVLWAQPPSPPDQFVTLSGYEKRLSARQKKVMELETTPKTKRKDIARRLKTTESTVSREVARIREIILGDGDT
jgi:DNA-binding NarL/FixJ family response regulator